MQACLPRSYLTPVRDEEAESQRKARSRQARQTRRSTQGVTLAELKEAKRTYSLSPLDRQTGEPRRQTGEPHRHPGGACLQRRAAEESPELQCSLVQWGEAEEHRLRWSEEVDELGNWETRSGTKEVDSPTSLASPSSSGAYGFPSSGLANCIPSRDAEWRDENENIIDDPSELVLATKEQQQARDDSRGPGTSYSAIEHDRASRSDSISGESATDRLLSRTSSYTRREQRESRLASLSRAEDEAGTKDYKKLYDDALAENEKLKSRLEDSKQELAKIRTQLERVAQKQERISERSTVFETEKREKQVLEKKVSDMEEELKVLTELKSDNQRLKDENGALIRVISKLSK